MINWIERQIKMFKTICALISKKPEPAIIPVFPVKKKPVTKKVVVKTVKKPITAKKTIKKPILKKK